MSIIIGLLFGVCLGFIIGFLTACKGPISIKYASYSSEGVDPSSIVLGSSFLRDIGKVTQQGQGGYRVKVTDS